MDAGSDEYWMGMAIAEARKGVGLTAPNPPVGAVVVKEGELLGSGWHRMAGMPHAEREAIADARAKHGGDICDGATVYVTLEPCSTTGRTPPCCDGLIEAGISRVVWGAMDPNPAHAGAAEAVLAAEGIATTHGVLVDECLALIRGFASAQTRHRPWVIAKSAMSLDGRVTRPEGEGQWLTGEEARDFVQGLRTTVDAVVTSGATVRADDPQLTLRIRHPHGEKQPLWRVVFSRGGALPADARLFNDEWKRFTLIVLVGLVDGRVVHSANALLGEENVVVVETLEGGLRALADRGIHTVLLEAGGRFLGEWMDRQLVDEYIGLFAPVVCGGGVVGVGGIGVAGASSMPVLRHLRTMVFGGDVMVRGELDYRGESLVEELPLRPCVFFDRDGVVNDPRDSYYVTRWSEFHFMEGIEEVILDAKLAGCMVVLVTSQRGVGKGEMTRRDLDGIHERMQAQLAVKGAAFDAIYAYCGESKDGFGAKPRADMIYQAVCEHGVDLRRSIIVGDADRDIEMGINAGIPTIRFVGEKAIGVAADYTVRSIGELAAVLREWCQFGNKE